MRIIKTNVDDLAMEIFNLCSGLEWFVNGIMRTDIPPKYPQIKGDGITYILQAHEVIVYLRDIDNIVLKEHIQKGYEILKTMYAAKMEDNIGCAQHNKDVFGIYTVARPLSKIKPSITFESLLQFANCSSQGSFNINDICAVVYDPEGALNLEHNSVVYKLHTGNFTGCENIYPEKILVSSLGEPLGMYFSKVWSHIDEYFGADHPFSNTNKYLIAGEYTDKMPKKCFVCTSDLHDTNYVLSERMIGGHSKLPKIISICPWCFHAYTINQDKHNIKAAYNKIEVVKFPQSSLDLISTVPEYNLRILLKAICDNFKVEMCGDFKYVNAGEYIGISSINKYIKYGLYNHEKFKDKKLFMIKYAELIYV